MQKMTTQEDPSATSPKKRKRKGREEQDMSAVKPRRLFSKASRSDEWIIAPEATPEEDDESCDSDLWRGKFAKPVAKSSGKASEAAKGQSGGKKAASRVARADTAETEVPEAEPSASDGEGEELGGHEDEEEEEHEQEEEPSSPKKATAKATASPNDPSPVTSLTKKLEKDLMEMLPASTSRQGLDKNFACNTR